MRREKENTRERERERERESCSSDKQADKASGTRANEVKASGIRALALRRQKKSLCILLLHCSGFWSIGRSEELKKNVCETRPDEEDRKSSRSLSLSGGGGRGTSGSDGVGEAGDECGGGGQQSLQQTHGSQTHGHREQLRRDSELFSCNCGAQPPLVLLSCL